MISIPEEHTILQNLTVMGIWSMEDERPRIAVFSSAKAPGFVILQANELAKAMRRQPTILISGFHAPVEEEVWDVVWTGFRLGKSRNPRVNEAGPVLVKVLARGMHRRIPGNQKRAIENGRLVLLSPFPETVTRASKQLAEKRNRVAASLADEIIIAHAEPGSSTFSLAEEVLGWGKPVYTFDHPSNRALLDLGVEVLKY